MHNNVKRDHFIDCLCIGHFKRRFLIRLFILCIVYCLVSGNSHTHTYQTRMYQSILNVNVKVTLPSNIDISCGSRDSLKARSQIQHHYQHVRVHLCAFIQQRVQYSHFKWHHERGNRGDVQQRNVIYGLIYVYYSIWAHKETRCLLGRHAHHLFILSLELMELFPSHLENWHYWKHRGCRSMEQLVVYSDFLNKVKNVKSRILVSDHVVLDWLMAQPEWWVLKMSLAGWMWSDGECLLQSGAGWSSCVLMGYLVWGRNRWLGRSDGHIINAKACTPPRQRWQRDNMGHKIQGRFFFPVQPWLQYVCACLWVCGNLQMEGVQ